MKVAGALAVLMLGGMSAWGEPSFTGHVTNAPTAKSLRTIYEDQHYQFAGHHFGTGGEDGEPSLYVCRNSTKQWARLDQVVTRDAVLGRSPDFDKVTMAVGWDHAGLKNQTHAAIPLRTGGSIMLPDKIEFDAERKVYRLTHGSTYGEHSHPTILAIRRDDLDAFFAAAVPPAPLAVQLAVGTTGDTVEVAAWFVNRAKDPQAYKGGLGMRTSRYSCTLTLTDPDGKQWSADAPPLPEHQHYKDVVVPPGGKVLIGRWDLTALRYSAGERAGAGAKTTFAELPKPARWQVQWWDGVFQLGSPLRSGTVEFALLLDGVMPATTVRGADKPSSSSTTLVERAAPGHADSSAASVHKLLLPQPDKKVVPVTRAENGKTIRAVVGQTVEVCLPTSEWQAETVNSEVVGFVGNRLEPFGYPQPDPPGDATTAKPLHTAVFAYRALKPGRADLQMKHIPPAGLRIRYLPDGELFAVTVEVLLPSDGKAAERAAQTLEPFYRNGWHGWPVGTEVRVTFLDDKVDGWYSYVQPDLVYRLTETALTRTQVVDGKPVVQQFDPANEAGWQPAYLHKLPTAKTTPTTIEIDGVKIDCLLYESTMDDIGRDVGGTTVLKEWVLADQPTIWLRTEVNQNYKVIKSLRALKQVGDRQVPCVVVEERMQMSGGHQVSTTWLSSEVPGHLVEKISQIWLEGRQQRSHEKLVEVREPSPATVAVLIRALTDSADDQRAKAAAELRRILTGNPAAAPNRHERAFWEARLAQIKRGMSAAEALRILLPDATPADREKATEGGAWSGGSGVNMCRLDDYWVVTLYLVDYANKKIAPEPPPAMRASARSVWVKPTDDYAGSWTTYFVNGQKAHEIQYRAGKYDGPFTAFHDDGSKANQQHYKAGVCHGTDTGWHRNGQKAYEGIYEHGKQIGTWRWWDEAGKVTSEKTFTEPTP